MIVSSSSAEAGSALGTVVQEFSVRFDYPVAFTRRLFDPDNPTLIGSLSRREPDKCHRCLVFVDEGVLDGRPDLFAEIRRYVEAHRGRMALAGPITTVPGGEVIKSELTHIERMHEAIWHHHVDRHAYVIAIGGGAVLDAVGLAAATAHRGVRHIRIPTTVLAQNDSGVGVKNAVNVYGVKNFAGTFAPPWAVLNDLDFLETLPPRERIGGLAEAVKVALIRDGAFFRWLQRHADDLATFEPEATAYMVRRCAELHMHQIAKGGDPFETGSARPLDFGHWAAHKLEGLTKHRVRHGEAVAIGIALDTRYSVLAGLLPEGGELEVAALLEHLGFALWHPALLRLDADGTPAILAGLRDFQEHLGGELTVTLLQGLGRGIEVHHIDHELMMQAAHWLKTRQGD
ncbi:MAG: 3-dehydroquinate synthase [Pseudomonadota bacterium]